tara:strand:+ start:3386 stop:3562 length:177 start_codon:yes stop_codon:yes gene_type:complete
MERKRFNYNDKLWYAKEEVKDLERLLQEAQQRLDKEYEKNGGRTWYQWLWYVFGYYYD